MARLADYLFVGANHPLVWIAHGNAERVNEALKNKELSALTTFNSQETALELAVLAGQRKVFELFLKELRNSDFTPSEKQAIRMIKQCFTHHWMDEALYFLNFVNDPNVIKEILIVACKKNYPELCQMIIEKKVQNQCLFITDFDLENCMEWSLKNQNKECFEWLLKRYSLVKNEYSNIHLRLLLNVIKFTPPEDLPQVIVTLEKLGYNISLLEKHLIYHCQDKEFFPSSYKLFYLSLPEEKRLKLPLQKWWQLHSISDKS